MAQKPDVRFRHITANDGLSQSTVHNMLMDFKGIMWFATADGLKKYDGYEFTLYKNNPNDTGSIRSNEIWSLFEDSKRNIWIGSRSGVDIYDRDTDTFIHTKINELTASFFEDENGDVWIGAYETLVKYGRKENTFTSFPADGKRTKYAQINGIFKDSLKHIWVGTSDGVRQLDERAKKLVRKPDINISFVVSFFKDSKNNLWAATRGDGLVLINTTDESCQYYRHHPKNGNCISTDIILAINEDVHGRLWIGTENAGLNVFDPALNLFFEYKRNEDPEGISSNSIYSVYIDKFDGIWLGTFNAGVDYVKKLKFRHFKHVQGNSNTLSSNSVLDFSEKVNGEILIATDGGGINTFNPETGTCFALLHDPVNKNSVTNNNVSAIFEDNLGNIWVGLWEAGIEVFNAEGTKIRNIVFKDTLTPGIPSNQITLIYQDRQLNMWLGTTWGLCLHNPKNDTYQNFFTSDKGLPHSYANCILDDAGGELWIGTWLGLVNYDRKSNSFKRHLSDEKNPNTISDNRIYAIHEDTQGTIWIGTNKGLNAFSKKTGSFTKYYESNGLPSDVIFAIEEDQNNNLWMSTGNGISCFNRKRNQFQNYSLDDDLQENIFSVNASLETTSGHLLFGGPNGFNYFDPDKVAANVYEPPVIITAFRIFNEAVTPRNFTGLIKHITEANKINLDYSQNVISIDFAALNYNNSEANEYAYKMEGLDENWNRIGNKRTATYTYIEPGEYEFKVIASNNDGLWNKEGATLKIIISPPFWKTYWFMISISAFALTAVISVYKMRVRSIKKQKRELETLVVIRTEQIANQNRLLHSQAETIQLKNENIIASIQYAKKIQEVTLPASTKLDELFQEHFIIYRPKDIVSGDFYWIANMKVENKEKIYLAVLDCTGHGVPGAFMSIIANTLLKEIIEIKKICSPSLILEDLNREVESSLKQEENGYKDGMDIALCSIEQTTTGCRIIYAGAKRPLYYYDSENGFINKLEADRFSIGEKHNCAMKFSEKEISLEKGSILYLTTDGYMDQNNPGSEKFLTRRFVEILKIICTQPLGKQRETLLFELTQHMGSSDQRDDITVVGVKI